MKWAQGEGGRVSKSKCLQFKSMLSLPTLGPLDTYAAIGGLQRPLHTAPHKCNMVIKVNIDDHAKHKLVLKRHRVVPQTCYVILWRDHAQVIFILGRSEPLGRSDYYSFVPLQSSA